MREHIMWQGEKVFLTTKKELFEAADTYFNGIKDRLANYHAGEYICIHATTLHQTTGKTHEEATKKHGPAPLEGQHILSYQFPLLPR